MSRVRAAVLAVVVSLSTFGLAIALVWWLWDVRATMTMLNARWFSSAALAFNGFMITLIFSLAALKRSSAEKTADAEKPGLFSASERLRREVERGKAGL